MEKLDLGRFELGDSGSNLLANVKYSSIDFLRATGINCTCSSHSQPLQCIAE
jgi:hypothetical protein